MQCMGCMVLVPVWSRVSIVVERYGFSFLSRVRASPSPFHAVEVPSVWVRKNEDDKED